MPLCALSAQQLLSPPVPFVKATAFAILREGSAVRITAGLGYHDVRLDVTGAIAGVNDTVTRVEAIVMNPGEALAHYEAPLPGSLPMGPTGVEPQVYGHDALNAVRQVETYTIFQFRHEFADRGQHRVSLKLHFGSAGEYVTSSDAVVIHCGDGLYGEF